MPQMFDDLGDQIVRNNGDLSTLAIATFERIIERMKLVFFGLPEGYPFAVRMYGV